MKFKILKLILIVFFCFLFLIGTVYATEENNTNSVDNNISAEQALEQSATVTSVTSLSNLPEANLGLNNILNILLLAVGFLLILFAIAILIRLKK